MCACVCLSWLLNLIWCSLNCKIDEESHYTLYVNQMLGDWTSLEIYLNRYTWGFSAKGMDLLATKFCFSPPSSSWRDRTVFFGLWLQLKSKWVFWGLSWWADWVKRLTHVDTHPHTSTYVEASRDKSGVTSWDLGSVSIFLVVEEGGKREKEHGFL